MSDSASRRWKKLREARIEPLPAQLEPLGDPAHGEKVRRCRECGRPAIRLTLFDFGLVLYGRLVGKYRLCEDCFRASNPIDPTLADPLDATAT